MQSEPERECISSSLESSGLSRSLITWQPHMRNLCSQSRKENLLIPLSSHLFFCHHSLSLTSLFLLSHHHSTCALVSEILESVLQTVQKQFIYRQYILTQKTMCRMHIHIVSTHSVLLDILAVINTHYTQNVHILHYVHLYTHKIIIIIIIQNKSCSRFTYTG